MGVAQRDAPAGAWFLREEGPGRIFSGLLSPEGQISASLTTSGPVLKNMCVIRTTVTKLDPLERSAIRRAVYAYYSLAQYDGPNRTSPIHEAFQIMRRQFEAHYGLDEALESVREAAAARQSNRLYYKDRRPMNLRHGWSL